MKLQVTARSDRGLVRQNNEDSAFAGAHLIALADGMGGHAAGEVASQLMITRLQRANQDPEDNDMLAILGAAARDANADIARHVAQHPETEGMGTTLTALMFNGSEFGLIHVGDSRGYRLRGGKLTQLTKDDTFVQSLVDQGRLDPEDVSSHPQKSLILKAYTGRDVEPTLTPIDAQVGDRLLLCSDGLSDPVTAATIESALGREKLDDAAQTLIELALRSGGPDNVTVVLAEVVEGTADAEPVLAGAIAGEVPEPTHPDSAASRAAKLHRTPQTIPATVPSTTEKTMAGEADPDDKEPARGRRRIGWAAIAGIVVALVVVLGAGIGSKTYLANHYYVAADPETQELSIQNGVDFSLFGRELAQTYQHACLNAEGELGLPTGECEGKFAPFSVTDLPETERGAVANLPGGSYDEAQSALTRLADKALPVCRDGSKNETKFRSEPGVNCRKVD